MSDSLEKEYQSICEYWRSLDIATGQDLAQALDAYKIPFAYNSNKIENEQITYNDTREVFEDGKARNFTGDPATLFEIQNQKECHELLIQAFDARREIDMAFVKEVHRVLTQGTYDETRYASGERPGEFKHKDYIVGADNIGAAPDTVEEEVAELLAELELATSEKILTVASYFHAKFENIHPFADGNGRVGRALMNYLFISYNHPPVIIYDEDRLGYYAALQTWDEKQKLGDMKNFLIAQCVKTWQAVLK